MANPPVPAAASSSSSVELPRLPHEFFNKMKKRIYNAEVIQGPCHLFLHLLPSSSSAKDGDNYDEATSNGTVNVQLQFNDSTKVTAPQGYAFPRPLASKPFNRSVSFEAVEFSSLHDCHDVAETAMPPEFPMEHHHREFLKKEIAEFIYQAVRQVVAGKYEIDVYVILFMERMVRYEETAKVAGEMEAAMDGRWRDEREDGNKKRECAVCCEEVENRWSEEGELFCGHVYHWDCIARWMEKKNTCPLCRYVQN